MEKKIGREKSPYQLAVQKAQAEALITEWSGPRKGGLTALTRSRGGTASVVELPDRYLVHTAEILGTKSHDARRMYELTGISFEDHNAQDTLAMGANDVSVLGAGDINVHMIACVQEGTWFYNETRVNRLFEGMRMICVREGIRWGGGETGVLPPIIQKGELFLACSCFGQIYPKERFIDYTKVEAGDIIFFILGSGIHANGLTAARSIIRPSLWTRIIRGIKTGAWKETVRFLPNGYLTILESGGTFGEILLQPTPLALPLVQKILDAGFVPSAIQPHTGDSMKKVMRARKPLVYVIERIPEPPEIFRVIQKYTKADNKLMYSEFNMGIWLSVIIPETRVDNFEEFLKEENIPFLRAGYAEKSKIFSEKKVVIEPLGGLEYKEIFFHGEVRTDKSAIL